MLPVDQSNQSYQSQSLCAEVAEVLEWSQLGTLQNGFKKNQDEFKRTEASLFISATADGSNDLRLISLVWESRSPAFA